MNSSTFAIAALHGSKNSLDIMLAVIARVKYDLIAK